jgi:hypothetical protein
MAAPDAAAVAPLVAAPDAAAVAPLVAAVQLPLELRAIGRTAASQSPSCIILPLIELLLDVSPPKPQELLDNSSVVLPTPRRSPTAIVVP